MVRRYYLPGTNIISDLPVLFPDRKVLEKIERYSPVAAMSAISWNELLYGLNPVGN